MRKRKLWFFFETGCEACAEAKPQLDAFAARHPDLTIERLDLLDVLWPDDAPILSPEEVPSYALTDPPLSPRTVQGRILTVEELETWVFRGER